MNALAIASMGNVWVAAAIALFAGIAAVALLLRPRKVARRVRDVGPVTMPDPAALADLPDAFDCCPACGCIDLRESTIFRSARFAGTTPMECAHCAWEGRPIVLDHDGYVAFVSSLR